MEKEAKSFIVCYDTGIDYHYEFDPENPDNDDPKEYDYVSVTADTMKEALEKAADEMQQHIGKIYPIDFESTMKSNVHPNVHPKDWKDIVEYIKENNVDIDISEILNELSNDEDANVRISVAYNENTPVAVLETLSKDEDRDIRWTVAGNKNTPAAILEALSKDEELVRINVARNRNTPVHVLETLATDPSVEVHVAVAWNKNTPSATLETLAKDEDDEVRSIVAGNENTPVAVLEALAKDEDYLVREAVAENENTPTDVLEALTKDRNTYVRDQATDRLEKPIVSASDLKNAKAEKDVRDAAAPKQEQKQKAQEHGLE